MLRSLDEPAAMVGPAPAPIRQRAEGHIAISVARAGSRSAIERVAEGGSARVRWPRIRVGAPEAVIINTAGGIAGGDRMTISARVGPGADLVIASAAAEKVYKSDGLTARIDNRLELGAGATCHWLPQETILFDDAHVRRSLGVEMAADATLLAFEAIVFGRGARAERMETGLFKDRWRVRRAGRLVFADDFAIAGPIADRLAHRSVAGGARAIATLLYVAPDAEARLDEARQGLEGALCECGASAYSGCLVVRFLAPDIATLRRDATAFMTFFRRAPLPRVWHL